MSCSETILSPIYTIAFFEQGHLSSTRNVVLLFKELLIFGSINNSLISDVFKLIKKKNCFLFINFYFNICKVMDVILKITLEFLIFRTKKISFSVCMYFVSLLNTIVDKY